MGDRQQAQQQGETCPGRAAEIQKQAAQRQQQRTQDGSERAKISPVRARARDDYGEPAESDRAPL